MKHYAVALGAIAITTLVGQSLAYSLLGVGLAVTYGMLREAARDPEVQPTSEPQLGQDAVHTVSGVKAR